MQVFICQLLDFKVDQNNYAGNTIIIKLKLHTSYSYFKGTLQKTTSDLI